MQADHEGALILRLESERIGEVPCCRLGRAAAGHTRRVQRSPVTQLITFDDKQRGGRIGAALV
jgi:hypothetical protein